MADKPKRMPLQDLASATKQSVQAAIERKIADYARPGVLTGVALSDEQLAALDCTPIELAKEIAREVSARTGQKVVPGVQKIPNAMLVGYLIPKPARK